MGCRHDVTGVFVKTWDSLEERGHCTADEDLASAKQVRQWPTVHGLGSFM